MPAINPRITPQKSTVVRAGHSTYSSTPAETNQAGLDKALALFSGHNLLTILVKEIS